MILNGIDNIHCSISICKQFGIFPRQTSIILVWNQNLKHILKKIKNQLLNIAAAMAIQKHLFRQFSDIEILIKTSEIG